MIKTKKLSKIDSYLKSYISQNNIRYKKNISSIFMNKQQLKQFYYGMIVDKQQQNLKKVQQNQKQKSGYFNKKKSHSLFNKQNQIINWKNVQKIQINDKPLITACEVKAQAQKNRPKDNILHYQIDFYKYYDKNTGIFLKPEQLNFDYPMPSCFQQSEQLDMFITRNTQIFNDTCYKILTTKSCKRSLKGSKIQKMNCSLNKSKNILKIQRDSCHFDIEELNQLKKQQQQKYVNKYRLKLGKKTLKKSEQNQNIMQENQISNIKANQKINKKLSDCFQNYLDTYYKERQLNQQIYGRLAQKISSNNNKQVQLIRIQKKKQDQISSSIQTYFMKKNKHSKLKNQMKEHESMLKNEKSKKNMKKIMIQAKSLNKDCKVVNIYNF